MRNEKTTCDFCGNDLTEAGPMPAYRLVLSEEKLRNSSGYEFAVSVTPPLGRPHHFCHKGCLTRWLNGEEGAASTTPKGQP